VSRLDSTASETSSLTLASTFRRLRQAMELACYFTPVAGRRLQELCSERAKHASSRSFPLNLVLLSSRRSSPPNHLLYPPSQNRNPPTHSLTTLHPTPRRPNPTPSATPPLRKPLPSSSTATVS